MKAQNQDCPAGCPQGNICIKGECACREGPCTQFSNALCGNDHCDPGEAQLICPPCDAEDQTQCPCTPKCASDCTRA